MFMSAAPQDTGDTKKGFALIIDRIKADPKVPLMVAGAAAIAVIVALFLWMRSPDYRVLLSNLSAKDGGDIVSQLTQMNMPYQLADNGSAILVPADKVHELRLKLAQAGLPKGGNTGFELLDKEQFGISQFSEQVNYQRALEGELSRTIESLSPVQTARVHLAIPKPTLFGLEFSRTAKEGGWDTFHNFFGLSYDPGDRIIFLYLVALLLVLITLFIISRLLRMPLGRAWEALREDEIACRSLGLSPTRIKLTAFTISAAFAGVAGTLFAARQGFISPESFTFTESAFVLAVVVLGGMGSQTSVILAAVILVVSREMMRDLNAYSMLLLGALMVLMMVWRPQGLLPVSRPHLKVSTTDAEKTGGAQ